NGRPMKAFTRSTPITLMVREHVPWLLCLTEDTTEPPTSVLPVGAAIDERSPFAASQSPGALRPSARHHDAVPSPLAPHALGSNAAAAYEAFLRYGALFPSQLGSLLQLVPAQIDEVLGELAAAGLVTSD